MPACVAWAANGVIIAMQLGDEKLAIIGRSLFSTANNICLVWGTVGLQDARGRAIPRWLGGLIRSAWAGVMVCLVLFAITTYLADRASQVGSVVYKAPDLVVSLSTLLLLAWAFPVFFWRTRNHILALLSVGIPIAEAVAQGYQKPIPKNNAEWVWCMLLGSGAALCALLTFNSYRPLQDSAGDSDERFPRRAAWLREQLEKRKWSKGTVESMSGPDHHTLNKILEGTSVRPSTLDSLCAALNKHGEYKVNRNDIPNS